MWRSIYADGHKERILKSELKYPVSRIKKMNAGEKWAGILFESCVVLDGSGKGRLEWPFAYRIRVCF